MQAGTRLIVIPVSEPHPGSLGSTCSVKICLLPLFWPEATSPLAGEANPKRSLSPNVNAKENDSPVLEMERLGQEDPSVAVLSWSPLATFRSNVMALK